MTARPFTLELTDRHLVREVPRRKRDASKAIARMAVKAYGSTAAALAEPTTTRRTKAAVQAALAKVESAPKPKRVVGPRKRPSQRVFP